MTRHVPALPDAEIEPESGLPDVRHIPRGSSVVELGDPALLGFPPTLPLELAMGEQTRIEILRAYDIDRDRWNVIRANPVFVKAVQAAVEMLQRDGMSFRVKARLQSEALLETSWKLIHSQYTPSNVKADLIKHTMRVAGLEPKEQAAAISPLQINIHL